MDSGKTPTALYIDLSKAFDTLTFDIILQKFKYYGVIGKELRLLTDYIITVKLKKITKWLLINTYSIIKYTDKTILLVFHRKQKH